MAVAEWLKILNEAPQLDAKYAWSLIDKYVADTSWSRDDGKFVKVGMGAGDIKAASGYSRVAAVAYFPTSRSITVDATVIAGSISVKLSWYDPTTGTYTINIQDPKPQWRIGQSRSRSPPGWFRRLGPDSRKIIAVALFSLDVAVVVSTAQLFITRSV